VGNITRELKLEVIIVSSIKERISETTEQLQREIMDQADDVPDVEAWQQLPEETDKAYNAFRFYLQGGPYRSLQDVATVLGKDKAYAKQLEKWSRMHNWKARTSAWDAHIDNFLERQYMESVLTMTDRHIQQSHYIQEKVYEQLMSLDLTALKPSELIKLYDITIKVERESCKLKSELMPLKVLSYGTDRSPIFYVKHP